MTIRDEIDADDAEYRRLFEPRHHRPPPMTVEGVEVVPGFAPATDFVDGVTFREDQRHLSANGVRSFESGADRDTDEGKLDFEGFLSPVVLEAFAEYMHKHRTRVDGTMRDSDNWQRGMPVEVYMKSMWRHFMDVWMLHRGHDVNGRGEERPDILEALMALLFNVQGMALEVLKESAVIKAANE